MFRLSSLAAAAAVLVTAGCAPSTGADGVAKPSVPSTDSAPRTVTIAHAQGSTEVPVDPETVFSFDYASLSVLDALDIDVAGAPQANLPERLSRYGGDDVLDIGTLFEPDYELVNAEQPDLIIVAGRSSDAYPELAKIAPTIDLSNDWADFTDSVVANTKILGTVFDREEDVAALIADLEESVAAVEAQAKDAGTALVILTSGGEITAYGPGSRFGFLHDALGLAPAVEGVEVATHGEAVSFEFVLEADPDRLFVVDRDAATGEGTQNAQQVLDNEVIHRTKAWQNDQVVYVDPVAWYIVNGGVPTLQGMAAEVGAALGR